MYDNYMVQARQFRKSHIDAHYAAAIFRYEREMSLLFRDKCVFVCLDDKHRIKIGEPGYPVAAVERGKRVMVTRNSSLEVGDYDFTKFSLVPSVCFVVDIPDSIDGSWYTGRAFVAFKDAVFEPSSPERHTAELHSLLVASNLHYYPILFLYSDGGSDNRLTYLSVQLSLISLFLTLDLDFLCACRTAPYHSWRNPVERLMSVVNLGLQSVGDMRKEGSSEAEALLNKCNNMKQIRQLSDSNPSIVEEVLDSLAPVKILLADIMRRLELKGKPFGIYPAASQEDIESVWNSVHEIDSSLKVDDKHPKASLKSHTAVEEFIKHCCQTRHYSFCIKKCGVASCSICRPPRLPPATFAKISFIPDPIPQADGHYKPFNEVYGTETSEGFRPSLSKKSAKSKKLPFSASVQHVRNVNLMLQCEECQMWRLLYSPRKLSPAVRKQLSQLLEDYTYTCGAALSDLELPNQCVCS